MWLHLKRPTVRSDGGDDAGDCRGSRVPFLTLIQCQKRLEKQNKAQFSFVRHNSKTERIFSAY